MPSQNHVNNPAISYGFLLGEGGWNTSYNNNFRALGAIVQLSVLSRAIAAQPVAPANGDRYIVPTGATGALWAGQDGRVAAFLDTAWYFYQPSAGWQAWVVDESAYVGHNGSVWVRSPVIAPVFNDTTRPAAASVPAGYQIWNTDDGFPNWSDGVNWVEASPVIAPAFNDTTRPAAASVPAGYQIWNTDDGAPNWSDGTTNWVDASGTPT